MAHMHMTPTRAAFGQHLDLHAGGVDLAFPHHENEIAQWRGCNDDLTGTWCKCWLHTGHLHIEGRKMSKSLKNFVTVRELLNGDDAVDPEAFRIFCGLHRYASTVSYSRVKLAEADAARRDFDAALRAARNALSGDLSRAPRRWTDRERALHEAHRGAQQTFATTFLDDANLPEALQALLDLATRLRQYCLEAATERRDVVPEPVNAAAAFLAGSLRDLGLVETAGAVGRRRRFGERGFGRWRARGVGNFPGHPAQGGAGGEGRRRKTKAARLNSRRERRDARR